MLRSSTRNTTRNTANPPVRIQGKLGLNEIWNESCRRHNHTIEACTIPLAPHEYGKNMYGNPDNDSLDDETTPMLLRDSPMCNDSSLSFAEQREKNGQCLVCGQQLFENADIMRSSRMVRKRNPYEIHPTHYTETPSSSLPIPIPNSDHAAANNRPRPLTIPGFVNRGQCLRCAKEVHSSSTADGTRSWANQNPKDGVKGSCVYTGAYNASLQRHGKRGILQWSNGDRYTGEFVNGQRHGNGTLTFRGGGGEYVGEFTNNVPHGSGTRRWPNGDLYSGLFVQGKRCGHGRFYFSNGDLYAGEFIDNHFHGFGRYYYNSNVSTSGRTAFEGYYSSSQRHGKGKVQYDDGSLEVAVYINDERTFPAIRWSSCRTKALRIDTMMAQGRGVVLGTKLYSLSSLLICKKQETTSTVVKSTPLTIAEAVSLDYELDAKAESLIASYYYDL